jgi:hypothetical protein
MDTNTIQLKINNINNIDNLESINDLLSLIVEHYDFRATVYVYDFLKKKFQPNDTTYFIINKLHSKTLKENKKFNVPEVTNKTLQPRRRIHKIIKGYNVSINYKKSLIHKDKIIEYLNKLNLNIGNNKNNIKLAKQISKDLNITITDVRYNLTHLKRIKWTNKNIVIKAKKDIDHYFK